MDAPKCQVCGMLAFGRSGDDWEAADFHEQRYGHSPVVQTPQCPDGGTCHHDCGDDCYRVENAAPLSGVFPGDRWPDPAPSLLQTSAGLAWDER